MVWVGVVGWWCPCRGQVNLNVLCIGVEPGLSLGDSG